MAGYFFDSSALAKFYHPEAGTPAGEQIVQDGGSRNRISRLATVEMTSVFAIKVRTGFIQREDAEFFSGSFVRISFRGSSKSSRSGIRSSVWLRG